MALVALFVAYLGLSALPLISTKLGWLKSDLHAKFLVVSAFIAYVMIGVAISTWLSAAYKTGLTHPS